jgi:hypothetical protein
MRHADPATSAEVYARLVPTKLRVAYQDMPDIPLSAERKVLPDGS